MQRLKRSFGCMTGNGQMPKTNNRATAPAQTTFLPVALPALASIPKAGAPASVGDIRLLPTAPPGGSAWDGAGT